jgi:exopolysaccharide biosynthesis operon protein EpsL
MFRVSSLLSCAAVAATLLVGRPVLAVESDVLSVSAGTTLIHDSNVFRLPDSVSVPANIGTKKSDLIKVATIGLSVNKPYAQQRFELEVSETVYRYSNFSFLDFEALNYRGTWHWHLTPRINGQLVADRKKTLVPFQDVNNRAFVQALRTSDYRSANIDGWLFGPWHVLAGISQVQVDDSRIITGEQAYDAITQEAGIKYLASSGNWITFTQRRLNGDYQQGRLDPVNLLDNGFREDQTEIQASWAPTGMSSFTGQVAWIDRQHEHFAQRDFEGLIGRLNYVWGPTGKLRFNAAIRRDIGTWWDGLRSSYRTSTGARIGSTWQIYAHTAFEGSFDWVKWDYHGALTPLPGPAREDTEYRARLLLKWAPLRKVSIRAGIEYFTRHSNDPRFEFDSAIGSLSATVTF